ncbi:unnamed protein product [Closterium sp. NIES-53]
MYPHADQGLNKPDNRPALPLPPSNAEKMPSSLNFIPSFASPSWGPGPSSLMFASLSGSGAGAFSAPGGEIAHGDTLRRSASDRGASAAMHVPATWSSALTRAGSSTMDVFSGSPRESFPYTATTHSDRFSHAHYYHIGGNEKPVGSNAGSSAQGSSQLFGQSPTTDPRSWHERSNQSKGQEPLLSRHLLSRTLLPGSSRFESDRGDAAPSVFAKPAPLPVGQNHHPLSDAPPPVSVAGASAETAALHGGQCRGSQEGDGGGSAGLNNNSTRGASKKRKPVAHAGSRSVVAADGYFWHKYGQKSVMDRAITRAYFRCARHSMGCMARKTVDVPIATAAAATSSAATASAPSVSAAAASLATADGSIAKPSDAAPSSAAALKPQVSYHGTHNHSQPGPCSLSLPSCAAAVASAAAAEGDMHEPVSASPGAEGADGAAAVVPVLRTDHERRSAVVESADVAAGSGTGAADAASAVALLGLTHRLSLNSTVSLDCALLSPASAAAHPALALTLATPTTAHNLPAPTPADAQRPRTAEAAAAAAAAAAGDSGSCTDEPMTEQSKQSPAGTRGSMEVGSVRAEGGRLACSPTRARSHSVEAQPGEKGDASQRGGNGVGHHGEKRAMAGALLLHPSAAATTSAASHPSISAAFAAAASAADSGPAFALPSAGPGNPWAMAPPPGTGVPGTIPPGGTSSTSFHGLPLPALPMPMQTHAATSTHLASMAHPWGHHSHPSLPSAAVISLSPLGHHMPPGLVGMSSMHPPAPLFNPLHHSQVAAVSGSAFSYPSPQLQAAQVQTQMPVQAQLQLQAQLQAQQQGPSIHQFQAQPPGSADPVANSHTPFNFRSASYPQLSTSKPLLHHAPSAPGKSTDHHGGRDLDDSARHLASAGSDWNSIMEGSHQEAKRIRVEWGQTVTGVPEGSRRGATPLVAAVESNSTLRESAHVGSSSEKNNTSKASNLDLELKL